LFFFHGVILQLLQPIHQIFIQLFLKYFMFTKIRSSRNVNKQKNLHHKDAGQNMK
jgi:hypothetical protein